jgi:alpha-tubulin suppressor-like RCC1 family protein
MTSHSKGPGLKEVYTVGQNAYGELAHGDTVERHVFTLVEACQQLNVLQVAAGNEHTLILTDNGDLFSSGYNEIASSAASQPQSSHLGGAVFSGQSNNSGAAAQNSGNQGNSQ